MQAMQPSSLGEFVADFHATGHMALFKIRILGAIKNSRKSDLKFRNLYYNSVFTIVTFLKSFRNYDAVILDPICTRQFWTGRSIMVNIRVSVVTRMKSQS